MKELASCTDCAKNRRQWTLACNVLQVAKQPESREHVVGSRICSLLLGFMRAVEETVSELTSLLTN